MKIAAAALLITNLTKEDKRNKVVGKEHSNNCTLHQGINIVIAAIRSIAQIWNKYTVFIKQKQHSICS